MKKVPSPVPIREPLCPSLPPEIWINILRYHTDLAHLWTVCRLVSPGLRACAEQAIGYYFLDDVHIYFQLEKYNLGGKSKRPEISVRFDRRGKGADKHIAWYKDVTSEKELGASQTKKAQEQAKKVMQRWEENVDGWKPEMPNYVISIGDLVNDTALPGLEIDIKAGEICFEWKEMLRLFFREHARFLSLETKWRQQTARAIQANNARLAQGQRLMPADLPAPWSTAEFEIRKHIRRARLEEYYTEDEEMVWAIGSLKHFEQYGTASTKSMIALKLNVELPGAGLGEKWFGRVNLVQELYLDEWSCMHRIDMKREHLRGER